MLLNRDNAEETSLLLTRTASSTITLATINFQQLSRSTASSESLSFLIGSCKWIATGTGLPPTNNVHNDKVDNDCTRDYNIPIFDSNAFQLQTNQNRMHLITSMK